MAHQPVIVCEEEGSGSFVTINGDNFVHDCERHSLQLECQAQWNALVDKQNLQSYQFQHYATPRLEQSRTKLANWSYNLLDTFHIDRSIVSIAFFYYDRCLSLTKMECIDLVFISSLYLAIKIHSCSGRTMAASMMSEIMDGRYTDDEIVSMEIHLLRILDWGVHPPGPALFLCLCMELCEDSTDESVLVNKVLSTAKFLVELTVYDSKLASEKPSSVALAAVSVAAGIHSLPSTILEEIISLDVTSKSRYVEECTNRLQLMYNHWLFSSGANQRIACESPRDVSWTEEMVGAKRDGRRLDPVFKSEDVRVGRVKTRRIKDTEPPCTV
jgi:hypothetical protein